MNNKKITLKLYERQTIKEYNKLFKESSVFKIPERLDSSNYKISSSLKDVEKWKAKTIVANNGGTKGKFQSVGYVAINVKTNEIIPISRDDEHQTGYDLLHHFQSKGYIDRVSDWQTVFWGNNYTYYPSKEKKTWVDVINKWFKYGGADTQLISSGYGSEPQFNVSFSQFLKYKGTPPESMLGTREIPAPAKALISVLERLANMFKQQHLRMRENPRVFKEAYKLSRILNKGPIRMVIFNLTYPLHGDKDWSSVENMEEDFDKAVKQADASQDYTKLENAIFSFNAPKNLIHSGLKYYLENYKKFMADEHPYSKRDLVAIEGVFGDLEYAVEQFNKLSSI